MTAIEGFVLAGGQSRRMGSNKGQLKLGGLTLVERAANVLARNAEPVSIVGHSPSDYRSNLIIIEDASVGAGGRGSVVGLYTALLNAKSEWAAILACDLPLVGSELFTIMVSFCREKHDGLNETIDAILPRQPDGRIQPLCGLYKAQTCIPHVKEMLSSDNWRLQDLVRRLNTHILEFSAYEDLEGSDNYFLNVNTPEDFRIAVEHETKRSQQWKRKQLF